MADDPEDRVWLVFTIRWAAVLFAAFMAVYLSIVGPAQKTETVQLYRLADENRPFKGFIFPGVTIDRDKVIFITCAGLKMIVPRASLKAERSPASECQSLDLPL